MNQALGITAAMATLVCWTIGTFSFTEASKNAEPLSVNRVRLLFATAALSIIVLFAFSSNAISSSPEQWLWLGSSGIIGLTIGDYFAFTAYRTIGGSHASLFATFAPCAAWVMGSILLNEQINSTGLLGMSVSLSGITWFVWINSRGTHTESPYALRGMLFAMLGAVCQGVGLVLAKKGMSISHIEAVPATWMRMLVATGMTYFIGAWRTSLFTEFKTLVFQSKAVKPMLAGTLFGPVAGVSCSLLAVQHLEVSVAQTLFSMLPLSVILVAVCTGRERVKWYAWPAAAISIMGVVLLVWRNQLNEWMAFYI